MQTRSTRLRALALALLLCGGTVGLPVLDLVVWHLTPTHHATLTRSDDRSSGSDHDRLCVFTHQMPSSEQATFSAAQLVHFSLGVSAPAEQPTPRLISAEIQRANPPRGPPSSIA